MTKRKASAEDKAAVRELLAPEDDMERMIRELIAEGGRRGITVTIDLHHNDPVQDPWITAKDLKQKGVEVGTRFPTGSAEGDLFLNKETNVLYRSDGQGTWQSVKTPEVTSGGMVLQMDPEAGTWAEKRSRRG